MFLCVCVSVKLRLEFKPSGSSARPCAEQQVRETSSTFLLAAQQLQETLGNGGRGHAHRLVATEELKGLGLGPKQVRGTRSVRNWGFSDVIHENSFHRYARLQEPFLRDLSYI